MVGGDPRKGSFPRSTHPRMAGNCEDRGQARQKAGRLRVKLRVNYGRGRPFPMLRAEIRIGQLGGTGTQGVIPN